MAQEIELPALPKLGTMKHFLFLCAVVFSVAPAFGGRPNVLVAVSDDQSFPHASAYGDPVIRTPGFDEVAKNGMRFDNAFTPAPGCSPMRAAFLTGKYIWEIGAAGTHASHFSTDLKTFPNVLRDSGYSVGYTGKPWGPGKFQISGWKENPAGPSYNSKKLDAPKGISATDYFSNFKDFLSEKEKDKPFCFWFGGHEPHRSFGKGLGKRSGMSPSEVVVPGFLPDAPEVREDLLDYYYEIQWFDNHLSRMIEHLREIGELDNTLVVVTSDNGMSFPRAKANLYEYGIHMPLAISLPNRFPKQQATDALVNLIDVTATIYDVCGVKPQMKISGRSLAGVLSGESAATWDAAFSGRERHSSSRWNSLGYPCRCVRTKDYLYIKNYAPERWPAGTPQKYAQARYDEEGTLVESTLGPAHGGYHDIDACPTLSFMIQNRTDPNVGPLFELSVGKRPAEELYDIRSDSACLRNLVGLDSHATVLQQMRERLSRKLTSTGDLRETDYRASHVWEQYPRYSSLRWFPKPEWAGSDHSIPRQDWLEQRRPRVSKKKER